MIGGHQRVPHLILSQMLVMYFEGDFLSIYRKHPTIPNPFLLLSHPKQALLLEWKECQL